MIVEVADLPDRRILSLSFTRLNRVTVRWLWWGGRDVGEGFHVANVVEEEDARAGGWGVVVR